jgi:signal transduction histidine kinase
MALWDDLLFWSLVVVVVNLFPVVIGDLTLTLDMPVLLAAALLYPPEIAALLALVSALDIRELSRRVSVSRAIFNRVQIALSVFLSSSVFHTLAPSLEPWPEAILATAAAIAVFHTLNMGLVVAYTARRTGYAMWNVLKRMIVGHVLEFLSTYLGYGVLALVLGRLYEDVGSWSVVVFVLPLIVARQMFVRERKLQALTHRLLDRERLLERSFDRIIDERRDERLRIASGLHDDVLQSLIRMSQLGYFLSREIGSSTQPRKDATELVHLSQASVEALRGVVSDLRTSPVGRGGLVSTLRNLAEDLQLDWGVRVVLESPDEVHVSGEMQVAVYQVAREGLVNALKHARASEIRVRLSEGAHELVLIVQDNGQGFDVEAVDRSQHFGIGLAEERVKLAGGRLVIGSKRDHGTNFTATFPIGRDGKPKGRNSRLVPTSESRPVGGSGLGLERSSSGDQQRQQRSQNT